MKNILLGLALLIPVLLFSSTDYKYIDIKNGKVQLGSYKGNWSVKSEKVNLSLEADNSLEIENYLNINPGDKILLYFHSLYGGVNVYHKNSIKKLKKVDGIDKVISIIWHTDGLNYLDSWETAIETSKLYRPILSTILERRDIEKNVLCHSMGHRIFEGIIKDYSEGQVHLKSTIFAGTDMDLDVFHENLSHLPHLAERMVLYVHENDRLLKHSEKKHKIGRLGRSGLTSQYGIKNILNLERIDVSNSSGSKWIRLSNHIYFKRDNLVLEDLSNVLNSREEARKVYLVDGINQIRIMQ